MHLNESVPVERHAVAFFCGAVLLRRGFLAMSSVAAVLLCAREYEKLRAGYAAAAQKRCQRQEGDHGREDRPEHFFRYVIARTQPKSNSARLTF